MIQIDQASMIPVYPKTPFGILRVENFSPTEQGIREFQKIKEQEMQKIRESRAAYERKEFSQHDPVGSPYVRYYKKFKKTYHVMHQLESILKGDNFPNSNLLVQVLFLAELKHAILIACHDTDQIDGDLTICISRKGEEYLGAGEREIQLKENDIIMKDQKNILVSIIYGQDHNTRITNQTKNALYLVDGVPELTKEAVKQTLEDMERYLHILDPRVKIIQAEVLEVAE